MIRGRAHTVRLAAHAVILAHRPAPEVAHRRQLRKQPVPLGLQPCKGRLGHGHPSSGYCVTTRLPSPPPPPRPALQRDASRPGVTSRATYPPVPRRGLKAPLRVTAPVRVVSARRSG